MGQDSNYPSKGGDAQTYKGVDIDSDGDGIVNNAYELQGNTPSDLGSSFDNNTIIENANGNREVSGSIRGTGWKKDGDWTNASNTYNLNNPSQEVLLVCNDISAGEFGNILLYPNGDDNFYVKWDDGTSTTGDYLTLEDGTEDYPSFTGNVYLGITNRSNQIGVRALGVTNAGDEKALVKAHSTTTGYSNINKISTQAVDISSFNVEVYYR